MRRRIRPTTEDLEPRVVLSVASLTPRSAEPPVEETRTESPDDTATETPDVADNSTVGAEPIDATPVSTTRAPDDVVGSSSSNIDRVDSIDSVSNPVDSVSDDVAAVDPNIELKRIARLKRLQDDRLSDSTTTVGVVTRVDVIDSEPIDARDDVDTNLGDVRDVTDGDDIEKTEAAVAAKTHVVSDSANTRVANVSLPAEADEYVTAASRVDIAVAKQALLEVAAARATAETTDTGEVTNASALSWIDSLHSSALSWFGMGTGTNDGSSSVDPLTQQTASAAGVAGVLSLMAFGRKGMGESDRLLSGTWRGLLDLRDWRPTRSTNRRKQKSLPGQSARREPVAVAPDSLDEPELSDAFLMSVAVPVSPDAFAMSSIPADDDAANGETSQADMFAATAAVGATVAAGNWAARQRSNGCQSKPAPHPQINFGGTTFTRPRQKIS